MKESKIVKVMLDNSVLRNAVLTQGITAQKTIKWGDRDFTLPLLCWERKAEIPKNQAWRQGQVNCLPTIARLAREGVLKLFTYSELKFEALRCGHDMQGSFGDLLYDVPITEVPPALCRSSFESMSFGQCIDKDDFVDFCSFLFKLNNRVLDDNPELLKYLNEFEVASIKQIDNFKRFCSKLQKNHWPDAFHLWTAERNGFEYLLMIERKFPNVVASNKIHEFKCKPINPDLLLREIGIVELDPMPSLGDGPNLFY